MHDQNASTSISHISFSPDILISNHTGNQIPNQILNVNPKRDYYHKKTLKKINMNILMDGMDEKNIIEKNNIYDLKSIKYKNCDKKLYDDENIQENKINYHLNNKYMRYLYGKRQPKNNNIEKLIERIFNINKDFKKQEIISNNKINIGDKNQKNLGDLKGRLINRGIVPKNISKSGFKKSINNLFTRIKSFES